MAVSRVEELDKKCDRYWDAKCQIEFKYICSLIELHRERLKSEGLPELESDAELLNALRNKDLFAYNRVDLEVYAQLLINYAIQRRYTILAELLKYYETYFRLVNNYDARDEDKTTPLDPKRFELIHEQFKNEDACSYFAEFLKTKVWERSHPIPPYELCCTLRYISETFIDHKLFVFLIQCLGVDIKYDVFWNMVIGYYNQYRFPFIEARHYETEPIQLAADL